MPDRLLNKSASGVLALLGDSPYRSEYTLPLCSLRPCWKASLNSLWAIWLSVIIPNIVRVQHDEHVYQRTANGLWSVPIGLVMLVLFIPSVGLSAEMGDPGYGAGQPASASDIAAWNIDVSPDGQGLPPGQGTVKQGAELYAMKCAACHGPTGKKDRMTCWSEGKAVCGRPSRLRPSGAIGPTPRHCMTISVGRCRLLPLSR